MADAPRKTRKALPWNTGPQSLVVPIALENVLIPAPQPAPPQVPILQPKTPPKPTTSTSSPASDFLSWALGGLAVVGGALLIADQVEKRRLRRDDEERRQRALATSDARIDAVLARLSGLDALETRLQKLEKADKTRDMRAAAREQQRDQQALEAEIRRDRAAAEQEGARDHRAAKAETRRAKVSSDALAQQTRELERVRGDMLAEVQRLREQTNFLKDLRALTPPGPALDTLTAKLDETADEMTALYSRLEQYGGGS